MQNFNLEQLIRVLIKQNQNMFGFEMVPVVVTDTETYTASSGSFYYAVKAVDGDVRITEATDIAGNVVFSGYTIKEGDTWNFPLSEITFETGKGILYPAVKFDAFLN
jgi:hypothetical protein